MRRLRPMLLGLLALAACSDPKPPDPDLMAAADLSRGDLFSPDLANPGDMLSAYPAGPYGYNVGDTIAPLTWEGWLNPTAEGLSTGKQYAAYTMNDLRLSGRKYALIYAADTF